MVIAYKGAIHDMLVQCPSCSARYRVNADNIPPSGGRIRCPSCSHTFIVYPEAPQTSVLASSPSTYDEAKTSVADIAHLMGGANAIQQQQQEEEEDSATEIMSGASLPNFANMFGGGAAEPPPEDGTLEMENPIAFMQQQGWSPGGEDNGATEIVSADLMFGGPIPQNAASNPFSAPPAQPGTPSNDATQVASPDHAGGFGFPGSTGPQVASGALGNALFGNEQGNDNDTVQQTPLSPQQLAPAAQGPETSGASTLAPGYQGPWKLKTNFGLTYEFQDTKSLLNWMSSRDDLSGYTLAGDDDVFRELHLYPQLGNSESPSVSNATMAMHAVGGPPPVTAPATTPQPPQQNAFGAPNPSTFPQGPPVNPGTPSGFGGAPLDLGSSAPADPMGGFNNPPRNDPPRTPGARITGNEYQAVSPKGSGTTKILIALFIVFGLVVVGLSLHIFKIVDFRAILGLAPSEPAVTNPPVVKKKVEPKDDPKDEKTDTPKEDEIDPAIKLQVEAFVKDAERALSNNKLPVAKNKLKKAIQLNPKHFKSYDLLAETYEKLGNKEKAQETRKEVAKLRQEASEEESN